MAAGIQLFNADGSILLDTSQWLLKTATINIGVVDQPGSINVAAYETAGVSAEVIVTSNELRNEPIITKSNGVISWNRSAPGADFRTGLRVMLV